MKLSSALLLLLVPLGTPVASAQTITEFPAPQQFGTPHPPRITAGPDGNLWFTVQTELTQPYIGRITPEGAITAFAIGHGAGPLQITSGPDGNLWFVESFDNHNNIGQITTSGSITEFPIPTPASEADGIAAGPDGALWFTETAGNKIGRVTTSGAITEFDIPRIFALPGGIVAGLDGALWFTEAGVNSIGRITASGAITEFAVPTPNAQPAFIAAGPDGALWFTEASGNKIGRLTTSGEFSEFPIPTPGSRPSGIVAGLDGSLYFTESAGNKIGRITTSGTTTEFPIPTPGSFPQGIALGPDGAIWFTEFTFDYGSNSGTPGKIGRLSVGPQTCESDATTMCLNDSRFRVTADWRKPDGSTGQGQKVLLTSDSGYFWFFNPANIEIVTKVLNACADPFNAYWVFSAGLTDVEVTLRVVDTQTGSLKTYLNSLGTAYQPIQDTSAFATCP